MATETAERRTQAQQQAPSPHDSGAEYLLAKGWKCLGRPSWEHSLWLDPTKPLVSGYTEEPCMYDAEIREEYVEDGKVKTRFRTEKRQIMTNSGHGGAPVAARRAVFHPAVTPMSLQQALFCQLTRDAQDDLAKQKAKQ